MIRQHQFQEVRLVRVAHGRLSLASVCYRDVSAMLILSFIKVHPKVDQMAHSVNESLTSVNERNRKVVVLSHESGHVTNAVITSFGFHLSQPCGEGKALLAIN